VSLEEDIQLIGCCGACCGTCRALAEEACRGCKLGYGEGGRDNTRARCRMKVCCFGKRGIATCADCPDYDSCETIQGFFAKQGYKYGRYRRSLEFIRKHGYAEFVEATRDWKGAYGKLR
jgi:hypothetical protein